MLAAHLDRLILSKKYGKFHLANCPKIGENFRNLNLNIKGEQKKVN
jgi:hypothetical protein